MVVICYGEEGNSPRPIITASDTEQAKLWCGAQLNVLAGEEIPLSWHRYLSRGTGPGTAHVTASAAGITFEIWTLGSIK